MDNFDLRKYLVENKVTTNSRMMKEQSGKPDKTSMRLFLDELGFNSADGLFRTAMNAGDVHELIDMMADSAGGGQHPFDGTLTRGDFSQAGNAAGFSAEMIEDILDRDDVRTLERGIGEAKKPKHSRMMKEDEGQTQDLAQAFKQAGIDMNSTVKVIEAGGGPGGSMGQPKTMEAAAVLRMLKAEKASFERDSDEGEEVVYDFQAGQSYPGAKLAIMFGDQFEYIIHLD